MVKKKIVSIVPARGGSKGLLGKNIKLLAGKPMIAYTIESSKKSKYISETYVSTDDMEIAEISVKYGAKIIKRPPELATDTAKMQDTIKHALNAIGSEVDFIVLLQPTSPLRTVNTINSAIRMFIDNAKDYDSLMPISLLNKKTGRIRGKYYVPYNKEEVHRQDLENGYYECGAVFVYKPEMIKSKNMYGKRILPFIIESAIESLDIDDLEDFQMAEALMEKKNG